MTDPQALPVDQVREAVLAALGASRPVALTAPTGSGKSTQVPRWCAAAGWRTLVVEPRRVACRSLARYVSSLEGGALGTRVGYAVRHDDRVGAETRIAFVTPGVALQILRDAALGAWDAVILDEFHERRADVDLLLALLLEDHPGPLLVMSATMDGGRIAAHLGGDSITASGRLHPVDVTWQDDVLLPNAQGLAGRIQRGVRSALEGPGDVLVFLPGKGEIADAADALRPLRDIEVVVLHGDLPNADQDRVFDPGARRRVILATNVAETSVTLPRIGAVVDSGLVRRSTWRNGMPALGLFSVATDSAEQRAGRAGRLGPGRCIRLWSRRGILEERTPPELHREDLSDLHLLVSSLGRDLRRLRFLDRPRVHEVASARARLQQLGALDDTGAITPRGLEMVRLPLSPWFARAVVEDGDAQQDVVDLVAVASQGRPLFLRSRGGDTHAPLTEQGITGLAMVRALRQGDPSRDALHPGVLHEARRTAKQLRRLLGLPAPPPDRAPEPRALCASLLRALPMAGFTPRRRADAWGNGMGGELRMPDSLRLPPNLEAAVVLDSMTIEARGGRFTTMASCVVPCTLGDLRAASLGKVSIKDVGIEGGAGVCCFVRSHGTTVLERWTEVPTGEDAVECLGRLIREGRALPGAWARVADAIEAWNLAQLLLARGGRVDAGAHLLERLRGAGVTSGSDLPLLVEADLAFPGLSPDETRDLDARFPRQLTLGDATFAVRYDALRRIATLDLTAGRETTPSRQFLPSWPGWTVRIKLRNRVVDL
jgi:ATP-dependent helicase HrpB